MPINDEGPAYVPLRDATSIRVNAAPPFAAKPLSAAVKEGLKQSYTLLSLTAPVILTFDFSFMLFAVGILVGQTAENENRMAATTLATTTANFLVGLAISFLFTVSIQAGALNGALQNAIKDHGEDSEQAENKRKQISALFKNGLLSSAPFIPVSLGLMLASKNVLEAVGQDADLAELAANFLQIYSIAIPLLWLRMSAEQILFSFQQQAKVVPMALSSLALSTAGAYFLNAENGLTGIATAYSAGSALTCISFLAYLAYYGKQQGFKFFDCHFSADDNKAVLSMWKDGWPLAVAFMNEFAVTMILGWMAGLLGSNPLAAQDFASQLYFLGFIPLFALAAVTSVLVNIAKGAQQYEAASSSAKTGLITSLLIMSLLTAPIAAYPEAMVKLISFNPSAELMDTARTLVPLEAMAVVIDAVRYSMMQSLRVLGHNKQTTLTAIACNFAVGLPLAYALSQYTDLGVNGLPIAYAASSVINIAVMHGEWVARTQPENMQRLNEGTYRQTPRLLKISCVFQRTKQLTDAETEMSQSPLVSPREGYVLPSLT
jgi:Na+-driven multidrug efflux pump